MSKRECSQLVRIRFIFEEPLYWNCIALYLYFVELGYFYLKKKRKREQPVLDFYLPMFI